MKTTPEFSVVIPTCQRNDLLAKCLEQLKPGGQTLPPEQYEVIVTDDDPKANARELIQSRYPWASWVAGPRRGPASNRNNGASFAKGEWIAFTDDDCQPDAGWLAAYAGGIATHPNAKVFEGRVYADRPRRSLAETAPLNVNGGFLWSCNFAIKKSLFEAMQGFEEGFRHAAMEDVELLYRLRKRGEEIAFISDASVCHPWRLCGGWKEIHHHQQATMFYLSLHPEERCRINSLLFLRSALRGFAREIVPHIFMFRFSGLNGALTQQIGSVVMAARLAFGPCVAFNDRAERHKQWESL